MAYFHTTVLDEQIKALPTVDTASGSIATFDTDMTENLIEVVCDIQYSQASGTPTPDNPLPITVYTSLNLSHSGADTSNPNVTNIPFGQTVAKGTLNVSTGVLEITHEILTLRNDTSFNLIGDGTTSRRFRTNITYPQYSNIAPASHFVLTNTNSNVWGYYRVVNDYVVLTDNNEQMADVATLQAWCETQYTNGTPVQFLCELETPNTIQLSATQITALLNENNIWCDTGDTSVKYILSVGKAIS